jgi:TolB-like protein/DNA-binding winged helix-turn-helix (wHTH) protein/Tfp pilus assembly protein PilF
MGDFLLGDRRVRPSRNLVEPAAGLGATGTPGRLGTSGARGAVASTGQPVAVQVERKVMEVLVCLARSPGRVVTKDELVREVWDGRFVSDDVVWRSVRELRRALGDETRAPRYIETIPRRGYRLLAPVAEIPETAGAATARTGAEEAAAPDPSTSLTLAAEAAGPAPGLPPAAAAPFAARPRTALLRRRSPRLAAVGVAGALALFAALSLAAAWWLGARRPAGPAGQAGHPGTAPVRLAVLPLANLSGDADQEYFADGLTEELISRLGSWRPGRLAVVGRTSVMALKGHAGDAAEIGRRLGVAYLLEGGVRRDGERARVTVRLVRAADGMTLWSERQDVELRRTLEAESAIAERVARGLTSELLAPSRPVLAARAAAGAAGAAGEAGAVADPEAHDLELRGRYLLARAASAATLDRAAAELRAAADRDPGAAAPRSGLADCYHLMAVMGLRPPAEVYPRAEAAALDALERDPGSVEARTVLGSIRFRYRWDYAGAERELRRALAVNPSFAPAHHDYAWLLVALGRMDEGIAEIREAQRLEPLSLRASADLGWVLYRAGRPDEAIAAMRRLLDLEPGFTAARDCLERALARRGHDAESLAVAREGLRREGASPQEIAALAAGAASDAGAARRRIAGWRLARLARLARGASPAAGGAYLSPYTVAALEVDAGDPEAAIAALQRAVAARDPMVVMLATDPELAPIRGDRRVAGLLRRLGLPQSAG